MLSRANPTLRDALYAVIGYRRVAPIALPSELESATTVLSQSVVDDEAVRALLRARTTDRAPRRLRGLGPDAWGVEFR